MRVSGACRRMTSCNSQRLSSGNRGGSHDQPVSVDSLRRGLGKIPPVPGAHGEIKPKEPGQIISGHPVHTTIDMVGRVTQVCPTALSLFSRSFGVENNGKTFLVYWL